LRFHADAAALDQTPLATFLALPKAEQFALADGVAYHALFILKDFIVYINGNPRSL
jgi:hypothetical protein